MNQASSNRFRRWLGEPLLHFAVLGAALLGLYRWSAPPGPASTIDLSAAVIRGLRQEHFRRTGAQPTAEEEAALIGRFADTEMLYREALALGLDRGDVIVRRRLVQKMEFLLEGLRPLPEPSEEELQAFLAAHHERYGVPARVAITHVFASGDRPGKDAEAVAARLRQRLLAGADPGELGDPFLRGRDLPLHSERELADVFGTPFAAQVMALPAEGWSEPLRSSYGLHIVRVKERREARQPALTEVYATVLREYEEERRAEANQVAMDDLRRRYQVRVQGGDSSGVGLAWGSP